MWQRLCGAAVVAVLALSLSAPVWAQSAPKAKSKSKVVELQQKRRDVLAQRASLLEKQWATGMAALESVIGAYVALLDAELQMAKGAKERIKAHTSHLNKMRSLEAATEKGHKAGTIAKEAVLLVQAARMQAEIDLALDQN